MPTSFKKTGLSRGTAGAVAATAVAGAVTALWVLHRARKAERDNPPVGRFIEVDGTRLHLIDKGNGPVVVLLHGNTVLLQDFIACGLIDRLAEHHRVSDTASVRGIASGPRKPRLPSYSRRSCSSM
jgi:hypothetical protein